MIIPSNLRCEYLTSPIGIDVPRPRLSWTLAHAERGQRQAAYQIQAAESLADLEQERAGLWDSGKVASGENFGVEYSGAALTSGQRCFWRVRAWDAAGQAGPFSEPAWFEMGLLNPEDWKAGWIGFPGGWNGRALYFAHSFEVQPGLKSARVYASGLGWSELSLNGRKVGDRVLDPLQTNYTKRVFYITDDITAGLVEGKNTIGATVGSGWYGHPKLLLQVRLDYTDGSTAWVLTGRVPGGSWWRVTDGPIIEHSIFGGETYDARLEKSGWDTPDFERVNHMAFNGWAGVMAVEAPEGKLVSQTVEPIRVVATRRVMEISQPKPGVCVYNFGQNMAGWARLKVRGEAGTRVTLRFAESLYPDGTVNQENLRSARAEDVYILKGDGATGSGGEETWEPRFTYHGFRYVQVEGYPGEPGPDAVQARVVRTDAAPVGSFECDLDLFNRIHRMVRETESSNLHGLPTDCPQRDERMGWLNDMGARTEEALSNFNLGRLLSKWIGDIHDEQDPQTGAITDTAPFRYGSRPADPVSVCYLMIPWLLYLHYGDRCTLSEHYQGLKGWVDCLTALAQYGILPYSYYGDWAPPIEQGLSGSVGSSAVSRNTPGSLVSTAFYAYSADLLSRIANVTGEEQDALAYRALYKQIASAYQQKFWDEAAGGYGTNNQACNAISLYMGLVPTERKGRVAANLARDVLELHDGHLTTGNLATKYLLEMLTENGQAEAAFRVAAQESYPSWGYMLANGATTLWERWEQATGGGMNSHNHPMLGSVDSWLYKYVLGVRIDHAGQPETCAFRRFVVDPKLTAYVRRASGSLETQQGRVETAWEVHENGDFSLRLSVPVNTRAVVILPRRPVIEESGQPVWQNGGPAGPVPGILAIQPAGEQIALTVGSGTYTFRAYA